MSDAVEHLPATNDNQRRVASWPTAAHLVRYLAEQRVLACTPPADMRYWEQLVTWSQTAYGAFADATNRQQSQDWARFVSWCGRWGRQPLPASATTVRLYILAHIRYIERVQLPPDVTRFIAQLEAELAQAGIARAEQPLKMASLSRYISSIAAAHRGAEAPDPTNQGPTHQAKKLARRISDGNQQQRAPIRHPHIDAIAALPCDSYRQAQDVLLTLFAYEVGQRVGAIAQVAVEDVEPLQDGGARVRFWRHKTTDNNTAIFKVISPGLHRLLRTWLQDANITEGPVFRPLPGQHNHLKNRPASTISPRAIASAMKRCMTRIGIEDVKKIGGHSTRIGGALDIAEPGGDLLALMRYGNWKSAAMPLRYTQALTDAVNPIHSVFKVEDNEHALSDSIYSNKT